MGTKLCCLERHRFCLLQNLPKNLHIVVVDLPGHGDTTIPDPDDDVRVRKLVISLNEVTTVEHGSYVFACPVQAWTDVEH